MTVKGRAVQIAIICLIVIAVTAGGCTTQQEANRNADNANAAATAEKKSELPPDAKPLGQAAPGFYEAGPTGNVSLHFTSPKDGEVISTDSVSPTFTITGYPIYMDTARNKGQHIHVIIDNEPYEADYDPSKPFNPANGKFSNLKPGTHTLRAFPSREWHESIKQTDAADFDFIVFGVRQMTSGVAVDQKAPLLTFSRPKGEYRWKEDPRGILLDFYVTNATIGPNDYKVRYTLNGKKSAVLNRWEPVWLQYEEFGPGEQKVLLELLDKNEKPVPFKVGDIDYNRTERTFKILAEGEKASASPDHHGEANRNAK